MGPVIKWHLVYAVCCLQREIKKMSLCGMACCLSPCTCLRTTQCSPGNPYRIMVNVVLSSLFHIWWRSGRQEKFKPENIWYQMQERRDFVCTLCAFLAAYCNLCLYATTSTSNHASGLRSQVIEGKRNEHSHSATILDYGYSHGSRTENTHREVVAEIMQTAQCRCRFREERWGCNIPAIHILPYQQG